MMKPSLQLKMTQQLTMTPQLQQAIKLLQLSSLELQSEIEEALVANPLLELESDQEGVENSEERHESGLVTEYDLPQEAIFENTPPETNESLESVFSFDAIPDQLPVDSRWDDVYANYSSGASSEGEDRDFESFNSPKETLQSHLLWQLNLTLFTPKDRIIADAIIEAINDEGYLACSLEEIREACGDWEIEDTEIEAVLHRIQRFDPVGVGSRDLRECLLIQLDQHYILHPFCVLAKRVVRDHLPLLAQRNHPVLKRTLEIDQASLTEVIKLIQSCYPKPGDLIASDTASYVIPDLKVTKQSGRWVVEINPDVSPRLRVNPNYAALIRHADASSDNTVLRNYLQEARWFIKSLQSRNETLLKVATKIVEFQQPFLEYGEEAMKPLVLHDIANAIEMHESTISRITTQKYLHTPRGIFELKYFFSSHVNMQGGGECSSTAIRALIKKLVVKEDPKRPLSDQKIAQILKDQGIFVARRTVAKYRESLDISASNERKCLV